MSRLQKRISAIAWIGAPVVSWTSGNNGAPVDLANYLRNDQRKVVAYAATGLPAGVTLTGSQLSYNGAAPAVSATPTFTATYTEFTVTTTGTVTIASSQTNQPPQWTVPDGYAISVPVGQTYNLAQHIVDAEGDPWVTTGVGVSADGILTASATPSTYDVVVDLLPASSADAEADWLLRSGLKLNETTGLLEVDTANTAAAGVVWAHDFRYANEAKRFSQSSYMQRLDGSVYKLGRNQDLTPSDPATFETTYGYCTLFEFNSGAVPNCNSGYIRSVMPNPIAFNGWDADTWFETPQIGNVVVHFPDGSTLPPVAGDWLWPNQLNYYRMTVSNHAFTRPMTPIIAGDNGLPYADNAARGRPEGEIPRIAWPIKTSTSQQADWAAEKKGCWTHSTFAADGSKILGHEWWLQMRIRLSPGMHTPRADVSGGQAEMSATWSVQPGTWEFPPDGKLVMINAVGSLAEEIVTNTGKIVDGGVATGYATSPFRAYTRQGPPLYYPMETSYSGRHIQTNAERDEYHNTCRTNLNLNQPNACWEYPEGEWFTIMYHVRPGRPCTSSNISTAEYPETLIEIKVARWGDTEWTTLYYDETVPMVFGSPYPPYWTVYDPLTNTYSPLVNGPPGHNVIGLFAYKNQEPSYRECYQEYTQVIFSTQEIPCPQVY